jgi:hypothetical protein
MECENCGAYTEISYGVDLVLCSQCACEEEMADFLKTASTLLGAVVGEQAGMEIDRQIMEGDNDVQETKREEETTP